MADYYQIFSKNMHAFRKKAGLRQKELGELLGYSEKTVSKWELGVSIPCAEVLIRMAEIFETSMDSFFKDNSKTYYLGIDGGATKTELELADGDGHVIRNLKAGACNPCDIGVEAAQVVLKNAINQLCEGIPKSNVVLFAGLGGSKTSDVLRILKDFFHEFHFAAVYIGSDSDNVNAAGLGLQDGISLILGTGICACRVLNGESRTIAGWGYLIDNGGSGYNIGRDALHAIFSAWDGSGAPTLLTDTILNQNTNIHKKLDEIYQYGKRYIASYAPVVFEAAERGDKIARNILKQNMKEAARLIEVAAKPFGQRPIPLVLTGGLTKQKCLLELLTRQLKEPEKFRIEILGVPPVKGAVMLAKYKWQNRGKQQNPAGLPAKETV